LFQLCYLVLQLSVLPFKPISVSASRGAAVVPIGGFAGMLRLLAGSATVRIAIAFYLPDL
jgi:hypothetical protein